MKPPYHSQVGGLQHQAQAATANNFYRSAGAKRKGDDAKMSSSHLERLARNKGW